MAARSYTNGMGKPKLTLLRSAALAALAYFVHLHESRKTLRAAGPDRWCRPAPLTGVEERRCASLSSDRCFPLLQLFLARVTSLGQNRECRRTEDPFQNES